MDTKQCKQFMPYTLTYLWGIFWLILGLHNAVPVNGVLFKPIEIAARYFIDTWPSQYILMCICFGNICYGAMGCFCSGMDISTKKEKQYAKYFYTGMYFCFSIISILYFTKIVVMITTVQLMSQFMYSQKTQKVYIATTNDNLNISLDTIPDTIPVGGVVNKIPTATPIKGDENI